MRVVVEGSTQVDEVSVGSGATLQVAGGSGASFGTVTVSTDGEVTLNGNFPNVVLVSPTNLTVTGGTIANLTLTKEAAGASVKLDQGSKVDTLNAGSAANISGLGEIRTAAITAAGVTITQTPKNVILSEGVTSQIGGMRLAMLLRLHLEAAL